MMRIHGKHLWAHGLARVARGGGAAICYGAAALALGLVGCVGHRAPTELEPGLKGPKPPAAVADLGATALTPPVPPLPPVAPGQDPLRPQGDPPPEERAVVFENGVGRVIDARAAQAAGYTLVDLRDGWTPLIFATAKDDRGEERPNRYRRIYQGLANDKLDADGLPLAAGEKNYLEVFGIPPTLSVLRERFLTDAARACEAEVDFAKLGAVKSVRYASEAQRKGALGKLARLRQVVEAQRRKRATKATLAKVTALVPTVAAAETPPALSAEEQELQRSEAEQAALAEVERRLRCEGFVPGRGGARHTPGVFDEGLQDVLKRFQQKHMVYEGPYLRSGTMARLAKRLQENNLDSLRRVLRERVVAAAGILEDGSADVLGKDGPPRYLGADGQQHAVRNLVDEFTDAAVQQMGLTTPERGLAFFQKYAAGDFGWLRVAVKLPPRPDYYGPQMDLSLVIDRGDVWYDPPFDEKGRDRSQSRQVFPSLTLYNTVQGQKVPLVRWRTTVGGWRSEQAADGYEYFRYKGSDVGPRVIRQVVSGPVWIAPETTPIRTLVKSKGVRGTYQPVVNYDEIGPGFRSAYGLVAGYFVVPGENGKPDFDNGIRAHGSAEYLSIGSSEGFSHGCHRLLNHLAVRMYSFILSHRKVRVVGDMPLGSARSFLYRDEIYELRIPSRGFAYVLEPPLPVNVLEGRIRGEQKTPITEYVPKPGVVYPGPPPALGSKCCGDDRSGGGRADSAAKEGTP